MGGQFKPVRDEQVSIMPNQASPTGQLSGPVAGNGTMKDPDNLQVKT
jgi:anti-sigma-K factor RskA